ncbi:MAG: DUF3825 domain-containing protein [Defluviitaleaceae bacterium]|nr:DUF3825 domain-containing protein [Defluviitaleaceae bacterium]
MDRERQIEIISEEIANLAEAEPDGWLDLAKLGGPIMQRGISYKGLDDRKLRDFLQKNFSTHFEIIKKDMPDGKPPVYYVKNRTANAANSQPTNAYSIDLTNIPANTAAPISPANLASSVSLVDSTNSETTVNPTNVELSSTPFTPSLSNSANHTNHFISQNTPPQSPSMHIRETSPFFTYSEAEKRIYETAAPLELDPRKELEHWAWMSFYEFPKLKAMALSESWFYGKAPPTNKDGEPKYGGAPILYHYLKHTFRRIICENKLLIATDNSSRNTGNFVAFNTGLVDKKFDDIYALFEYNDPQHKQPWKLSGFAVAGEKSLGKRLTGLFKYLPQRAKYFNNATEIVYDTSMGKPDCDFDHIIKDRIDRFPIDFIVDCCSKEFTEIENMDIYKATSKVHLPQDEWQLEKEKREDYFRKLGNKIFEDSRTYKKLKNGFENALEIVFKRIVWNYKTVSPMYSPRENKILLLLPLALTTDEKVDLALVVEKTQSGRYQGHTVLPLWMAHSNARLVMRPDSDWLNPEELAENSNSDISTLEHI